MFSQMIPMKLIQSLNPINVKKFLTKMSAVVEKLLFVLFFSFFSFSLFSIGLFSYIRLRGIIKLHNFFFCIHYSIIYTGFFRYQKSKNNLLGFKNTFFLSIQKIILTAKDQFVGVDF